MSEWNESTLRSAASWQAFKAGKHLADTGAVSGVARDAEGWTGTVKEGKRGFKVRVRVRSATDLDARCGCAENQATGAVCAHAVATGLAALRPVVGTGVVAAAALPERAGVAVARVAEVAWRVSFPPNWLEALRRGRLMVSLVPVAGEEVTEADRELGRWVGSVGGDGSGKGVVNLALDGGRLGGFLEAVCDHPRVELMKSGQEVVVERGVRFGLERCERVGDLVRMVPGGGELVRVGDGFWVCGADRLGRLGTGKVEADGVALLGRLGGGEVVEWGLSRFLGALGELQEWLEWPVAGWLEALQFVAAPFSVRVELEGDLRVIEAGVGISYGDEGVGLPRVEGNRVWVRDAGGEAGVWRRFERAGFVEKGGGKWGLVGEERVMHFVTHELPEWEREWSIESGRRFRSASQQVVLVRPRIEIRGSGEDWLRFDLKFQTSDGKHVSAAEIRQLLRHGNRGQAGSGGRRLMVSADVEELIDPLFSELDLRQDGGNYVASKVSGELVEEIRKKLDNRNNVSGCEDLFTFEKPESMRATLRPYQEQGAGWLEDRVRKYGGALLADDMGLGKTLQTIALIERLFCNLGGGGGLGGGRDLGRVGRGLGGLGGDVLVVATASLLGNWRGEFGRFAPGREVRVLHGAGREVERERVVEGGDGVVWLTSFGTLARDLAWHLKREYRAVVVDEASLMRNPDTDHAKALFKLRAGARVALTGTPVENGVRDLWSIFRFIQPGWLGSREEFRERYELPLADPGSAGGVMRRLRFKASPFVLRRTKEQVAADLPSKLIVDEFCELSPDQMAVYRQLLEEGRKQVEVLQDQRQAGAARMRMLTVLLRLRQTCCDLALLKNDRFNQLLVGRRSAKLERLMELLNEAVSGNHRVLVFSQFQTQLREIEKCLEVAGIGSLRLDGQTRNRQDLVDRFQKADGPPVFLISLKAGGYGLNLTAADTVIHFDPWWNPAAEAQASDRAHRIGQTRPVTVYRLLTRGTVEEKVVRMQERKRQLAGVIDEDGTGDAAGWSEGELMEMIRG